MSALDRVETHELEGSRLVFGSDPSLPVCRFAVIFKGGGATDPEGAAGAHRTMAELMLRGTRRLNREQFHARLERLGSMLYPRVSGDAVVFRGTCLCRHLHETLELLAEALEEPAFEEVECAALVQEIRDSLISERDDDETVAAIWTHRALWAGTPYARSVGGELDEIDSIHVDVVQRLYRNELRGHACSIVAVGDFDPACFENFLSRLRGPSPSSTRPSDFSMPKGSDSREAGAARVLIVDQPEREQVQLRLGCLTLDGHHADLIPFWLGSTAFGGTFSSPFSQEIREKNGWSYTAHVEFSIYTTRRAAWTLHSAPQLADTIECLSAEMELYRRVAENLERTSIEFARQYLLNRHPMSVASASDLMYPLIRTTILGRDPSWLSLLPEQLEHCPIERVQDAMQKHVDRDSFVVTLTGSVPDHLALDQIEGLAQADVRRVSGFEICGTGNS